MKIPKELTAFELQNRTWLQIMLIVLGLLSFFSIIFIFFYFSIYKKGFGEWAEIPMYLLFGLVSIWVGTRPKQEKKESKNSYWKDDLLDSKIDKN